MGNTRRRFPRGDFAAPRIALRPVFALHEAAFLERRTRCGACLQICPDAILMHRSACVSAYPVSAVAIHPRSAHMAS